MVDGQGCFLAPPILACSSCDAEPEGQRKNQNQNQWRVVTCLLEFPEPAGKGKGGLGEICALDGGGKGEAGEEEEEEDEEEDDDNVSSAACWKERKLARLEISSSGRGGRVRFCRKRREGSLRSGSGGEKMLGNCAGQQPGDAGEAEDGGEGSSNDDSYLPGLQDDIALQCFAWASRSDYGALASLNRRFQSLVGTGELYKLRRRHGIVEHWIYLVCDLVGWEAFDPKRHRWMRLPRMPSDECFNYADKESLAVGTELLVFGREICGFVICRYSLLTHSWSRGPGMNLPRCLFGSSSLGEIAIVAGGSNKDGVVLKSAELYNSERGTWETLPDMHTPRKLCSGFFLDGKFYVIGGMVSHTESLTCGEEFNLETRTWRCIRNMFPVGNGASQAPPLVAVVNNQLYAVEHSRNEVKKYNKETNTWSVLGRLPVRADSTNGWGLAFKACGNDLIVIGGQRGPEGESIELNSWRPTAVDGAPVWNVLAVKERAVQVCIELMDDW